MVVLTSGELLAAYRRTWPGKDDPLVHEYSNIGVRIPVADLQQLEGQGEPASAPAVAQVRDGEFRVPWRTRTRRLTTTSGPSGPAAGPFASGLPMSSGAGWSGAGRL